MRSPDVALLALLISAAEEDHDRVALTTEVNANPGTDGDPKLLNATSDRAEVAEVPGADPRDPFPNPDLDRQVSQFQIPPRERHDPVQPSIEANLLLNRHGRTVA